jgi:SSS family solute:Na+ symporter
MTLVKGGWLGHVQHIYPSEMAQNFWTAIFAWTTCFVVTILISLVTRQRKSDAELTGLVSSLTPRTSEDDVAWYKRPAALGVLVLFLALILNVIFW